MLEKRWEPGLFVFQKFIQVKMSFTGCYPETCYIGLQSYDPSQDLQGL